MTKKIDRKINGVDIIEKEFGDFVENGGEIGGSINVNGIIHSNNTSNGKRIQIVDNSITTSKTTGEWGSLEIDAVGAGASYLKKSDGTIMVLGTETQPFNELFLGVFQKGTNGYTKLANGLIMQWGYIDLKMEANTYFASVVINFPIIFPTATISLMANPCSNVTTDSAAMVEGIIATACGDHKYTDSLYLTITDVLKRVNSTNTFRIFWMALGY